ncbi:hypothetical protein A3D70_01445 [Candidatus Adlerbacteria bacterium RIFCSPHIGHO2_02_FULL_54_18]|uniref:Transcriptional repressor PaaX-like central Cas2-like domain-containing protein n=1 Tax=Candidatus Adlerbacteria bacterium RIFCSPHIGHO2_02_FULL_54_18 TaxID=1797241 RepID=A0A1F4Y422_9BACT|nr:MAG: hypothetical protein A3D70_01445 [Candidatus Adlerbacteria bacterium RIFCSPHIGHO2_02_FULL_54_18]
MKTVEAGAKKIRRRESIQKALLTTLLIGGMVMIGAAPRINILKLLGNKKRNPYRFKHQVNDTLMRLANKGFVVFIRENGRKLVRITPAGRRVLALEEQKTTLQLQKKKRWDKRWRVVIFDIPEYRRGTRDKLRLTMRTAGFYRLQDSVWIYPYDCEDFMALVKADLQIGNAVLYMVVEKIENDSKVKTHFMLS